MMAVISTMYETQKPVWQSGRRPPQWKFVVWVREFPGKFVYRNDITCG